MKRGFWALIAALGLTACAEKVETLYVPLAAPAVTPSSLTPQPVILFNRTKQGRKLFTLNEEFPYCDAATGRVIVVPRWYVTDFASVPWYGQGVIDPQGPTARAAIIHDWLYTIGEPGKRQEADDTFYRAMIAFGVDEFHARIAYNAVRAGGQAGYGLKDDWMFVDPTRPDVSQPAPFPKPATGTVRIIPGCSGFRDMVMAGWKAYPARINPSAVPPPVTKTQTGLFHSLLGGKN
ncbi:MAG: DUF1353 domain-containing protein [Asticcacaulis sp.]